MNYTNPTEAAPAIAEKIAAAQRILLLTHINPDGDALGSQLGMWHALRGMGKDVTALIVSDAPAYTSWLPNIDKVQLYRPHDTVPDVDLIILTDTASLGRIGPIADEQRDLLDRTPIVIVDHHLTNDGKGTVNLIDVASGSTCELLYLLLEAMNVEITPAIATCLLLGLTTDLQSFQTSATTPRGMRVAAALVEHGADQRRVVDEVYFAVPASSTVLMGMALSTMHLAQGVAWTIITQDMFRTTGAEDEAADEVVRAMQRVEGVKALVMFKERHDGTTKISLRSRPPLNIAVLAQRWGGGGHAQAAGATLMMPPAKAAEELLPLLNAMVKELG